jgi:hypothetical protein
MIDLQHERARSVAAVIAVDATEAAGQSRLARWSAALLRALHTSRRRQGERELVRYRHLICMDETHPDLNLLRRTCHSAKNSG